MNTPDTKEKKVHWNTGLVRSQETREKLRQANLGKKLSQEAKDKIAISKMGNTHNIGLKRSPETIEKLRQNAGRKAKPVVVKGIIYPSVKEAAVTNSVTVSLCYYRLTNDAYSDWEYA